MTSLVLAPTRWKLRAAVKVVNHVLASLKLDKHPDKTFIGRITKGFDWLGYHLSPAGVRLAAKTLHNFVTRLTRLYEQEAGRPDWAARLGQYVRQWRGWAAGGVMRLQVLEAGGGEGGPSCRRPSCSAPHKREPRSLIAQAGVPAGGVRYLLRRPSLPPCHP